MSSVHKVIGKLTQRKYSAPRKRILSSSELQHAIQCERNRADRRDIPFSIIVLGSDSSEFLKSDQLIQLLHERLRITDEVGWIDASNLGLLLPDTESDSACNLAADLKDIIAESNHEPQLAVFTYPYEGDDLEADGESDSTTVTDRSIANNQKSSRTESIQPQALSFATSLPVWKRSLDIVASATTLLLLSPFMLLAAILIKVSSRGPVFFTQWREGRNGQKFKIYKFRTMEQHAESKQDELRHLSEQNGPAFKIENDPRLTWFGAILRKSCFDETPQFFNILKGEMTLVGPRPLPVNESQACTRWQRRRLDVTPGMTCIWQVCGNRHMDFSEWMRMDQEYIRKSGFLTDITILFKTAVFVFLRRASV